MRDAAVAVRALQTAILAALLVAGCGRSDDPSAAAPPASRDTPQTIASRVATSDAAVSVRFVRLEATSEVNGNPWTSLAEFNLVGADGDVVPRSGWSVTADSEETNGENAPVSKAVDGDPYTFWHTGWQGASPPLPHALTIDLGTARSIGGFRYLPRQVGENGRIAGWNFYTSADGRAWVLVSQGTFTNDATEKSVLLATAPPATNHPPTLAAVANANGTVGRQVTIALVASDPDGDPLTYAASGLPTGLSIDAATGVIAGSPTSAGVNNVTAVVGDGRGGSASTTFSWTIDAAASTSAVRYVRLQAFSEVNGNPWTSVAELNLFDPSGALISRAGWTATADSEELVGENAPASKAVDGDPGSFWHTQWQGGSPPLPHALTIDLGSPRSIGGFRYLPRQVGVNGRIAGWRFYTSADGSIWTQVAQGTFPNGSEEQSVVTNAPPATASPDPSRAARIAAYASGPLVAGIPWRASEAVAVDAVRRLVSGQHLVYTSAGITGSVQPAIGGTSLDGRPIPDGSATAYVNGRVLTATRPGAPIVGSSASATSAGLVQTLFAAGDFQRPVHTVVEGCKSISTGTSFVGHYCFANGPAAGSGNATAYASGPYGAGLSPSYVYHSNGWEEEFVVTDRYFGLVFANAATPINVEIDGVEVEAGPTSSTGSEGWTLTFDYQGVVRRRVVRVVSAAGSIGPTLRGVGLTTQGLLEAGTVSTDQLLILGDSINATVTPSTAAGAQVMGYWLQRYLGFGAVVNMAVGGSGYVSQNANSYNVPGVLANPVNQALIASYAPTITHVIVGAGFNDRSRPLATVQAAALASWRALRVLLPNARISITDGWSGSSGPDADALALAAGLATTFATWNDGNSRLIHSVGTSPATAYISGTGHAGIPITVGNSSVYTSTDAVHPSPAGARYIARRLADDIAAAWAGAY